METIPRVIPTGMHRIKPKAKKEKTVASMVIPPYAAFFPGERKKRPKKFCNVRMMARKNPTAAEP